MSARVVRAELADAVASTVPDGSCVWIGNFGTQLFAVAHALIGLRRRSLHIVVSSGGIMLDQLLGAGAVAEATFAHCWSPVGPAPAWSFRRAWQDGSSIVWHELSIGTLCAALRAGAAGVPFMPVALPPDTGYVAEGWDGGSLATVASPFGDALVVAAIVPDVAFVHAALADGWGNTALGAPAGEAALAAGAARHVVVVAERIASAAEVRAAGITLPGVLVDTLVESPGAAGPDGVAGAYPRDVSAYAEYVAEASTPGGMTAWTDAVRADASGRDEGARADA